jgi:IS5 family transposase
MKAHVGVDSKTKIIHTAVATAANVADSAVLPDLLHGEETRVWGIQAYRGQTGVIRECAPQAQDCIHQRYRYKNRIDEVERAKNRTKSTVRSKVAHVFGVMKLKFRFVKLRYRGLNKNANQLFAICGLVNLPLLTMKIHRRIAATVVGRWRALLGLKTFQAGPGFQKRAVHREMLV